MSQEEKILFSYAYVERKRFEARLIAQEVAVLFNGGTSGGRSSGGYTEVSPDAFLQMTGHGAIK